MSFSHVQGKSNASSGNAVATFPLAFTGTVGSGNTVVGAVYWFYGSGQTLSSVTDDKGNTYTLGTAVTDGNTNFIEGCPFFLGNITNAPQTLTATFNSTINHVGILADEYSGTLASGSPSDGSAGQSQIAPGTGTDAISSGSITTTTNGDLIWGSTSSTAAVASGVAGTGYTSRTTITDFVSALSEDKTQTTAGAVAATFTQVANNNSLAFVVALKAAGGAAARTPTLTLLGVG